MAKAVETFGKLDILVNNAAIYSRVPIEHASEEEWDSIIDINLKGVFLGTKHSIAAMREAGGGSIINISSTAGLVGSPRGGAYTASKGGVQAVHQEHGDTACARRHSRQLHTPGANRHRQ